MVSSIKMLDYSLCVERTLCNDFVYEQITWRSHRTVASSPVISMMDGNARPRRVCFFPLREVKKKKTLDATPALLTQRALRVVKTWSDCPWTLVRAWYIYSYRKTSRVHASSTPSAFAGVRVRVYFFPFPGKLNKKERTKQRERGSFWKLG